MYKQQRVSNWTSGQTKGLNMKMLFLIFFEIVFFSRSAFSIAGPNGGHITKPGTATGVEAYNIELVDKGKFMQVYLLDLNLKNPVIENSSVTVKYINKEEIKIDCKTENNYFICAKPKETILNFKQVMVESVRDRIKAKEVIYNLPLKFD